MSIDPSVSSFPDVPEVGPVEVVLDTPVEEVASEPGVEAVEVPVSVVYPVSAARFTAEGVCLSEVVRNAEGQITAVLVP